MAAPAREALALPESECEIVRFKARIAREACCCEDLQYGTYSTGRFGALALWRFGALALWRFGALALWRFGALALQDSVS